MLRRPSPEQLVCDALIDLMEEKPFEKIKVVELVDKAMVSRSSFYMYFDSIYAVLQKIEDDYFAGHVGANQYTVQLFRDTNREAYLKSIVERDVQYLHRNLRIFRVLTSENGDPAFIARFTTQTRRAIRQSLEQCGNGLSETQKNMLVEFYTGGQLSALRWLANHEDQYDEEEVASFSLDLYIKSLDENLPG